MIPITVQSNDTTTYEPDDAHVVEHWCVSCNRPFFVKQTAFIDKGLCEPCYVRRAIAIRDFVMKGGQHG